MLKRAWTCLNPLFFRPLINRPRAEIVEILYCDNCNDQISSEELQAGTAVLTSDATVLCGKCAPLYKHSTTSLLAITAQEKTSTQTPTPATKSVTKFYFCETCGKRITDKEIEHGL